jgi:hypothetical protein
MGTEDVSWPALRQHLAGNRNTLNVLVYHRTAPDTDLIDMAKPASRDSRQAHAANLSLSPGGGLQGNGSADEAASFQCELPAGGGG